MPGDLPVDALGNPVILSTAEPKHSTSCITIGGGKKKLDHHAYAAVIDGAAGQLTHHKSRHIPRSVLTPNTPFSHFSNPCNTINQARAGILTEETKRLRGVRPSPGWVSKTDRANIISGCLPPNAPEENWDGHRPDEILEAAGISNEELNHIGQARTGNSGQQRRQKQGLGTMTHMTSTVDSIVWGHDIDGSSSKKKNHPSEDCDVWKKKFEGAAGQPSNKRYR